MYFVIIRDFISKLKNVINVRLNVIIIFILLFRLYVKFEKNSVLLIKVMLFFFVLLKYFVWVFRWLFGKIEYSVFLL